MTLGELKKTKMYINAEDVDICVNGEDPINEEYFYTDEICLLDCLPVVGTAHLSNRDLQVDLVCTNWDERFTEDWTPEPFCVGCKDCFQEAIIPQNTDGIRPDIAELINEDMINYRRYMIKQYNGNEERATDEFCFKKFLNEYSTAINIFGLHKEYDCKGSFNKFISNCWQIINGNELY